MTADKGYDVEKNHEFIREKIKGLSIIPLRPMGSGINFKGRYRKMLRKHFPLDKYHQRSKIETVNFVEKRKFGSFFNSRIMRLRRMEIKVIDIVYNIYRYMKLYFSLTKGFLQGQ